MFKVVIRHMQAEWNERRTVSLLSADGGTKPVGVRLYARSGEVLNLDYRISGYTVRVRSLDLNQEWQDIRLDLLGLVSDLALETRRRAPA